MLLKLSTSPQIHALEFRHCRCVDTWHLILNQKAFRTSMRWLSPTPRLKLVCSTLVAKLKWLGIKIMSFKDELANWGRMFSRLFYGRHFCSCWNRIFRVWSGCKLKRTSLTICWIVLVLKPNFKRLKWNLWLRMLAQCVYLLRCSISYLLFSNFTEWFNFHIVPWLN